MACITIFSINGLTKPTLLQDPYDDTLDLNPCDDWSTSNDPKERRRRQNRLNQRAYRKRKQLREHGKYGSQNHYWPDAIEEQPVIASRPPNPPSQSSIKQPAWRLRKDEALIFLENFSKSAYQSYILNTPSTDHLITLRKVNVFRAFVHNLSVLGIAAERGCMPYDSISQFNTDGASKIDHTKLPVGLQPTQVQRKILHHPWLDFFPFPGMRDNLISAGDFDEDQLCADIMGFWDLSDESCGLFVWGEPSDPKSWEVSEAFVKKWPWAFRNNFSRSGRPSWDTIFALGQFGTQNITNLVLDSVSKHAPQVKRVVITSSFAAMMDITKGNWPDHVYSEADWNPIPYEVAAASDAYGAVSYSTAKALAERAAWDFVQEVKPQFDIATIMPPMIYGPNLNATVDLANLNTSSADIYRLISPQSKSSDLVPDMFWNYVDVRDVAEAHLRAYEVPKAGGERFFICNPETFTYIARPINRRAQKVALVVLNE
ncbi:Protein of unknown function DUF3425 [Penicillium expansum]|uniref:NAD-dependent epimerase/dehydratase domain-containing protein n=1 Tax=Penicillium expansum TaxID=27334 RepID=A0A0A2JF35_PENEN|nr:Protein of unknown function DUF3425 [Penicillium expansum]KGO44899.1 Protein of unknown function DUF3425 [Penicillium expansum]KGO53989.1 Protein of unknown function DUF3425 [Penicillium expansum]